MAVVDCSLLTNLDDLGRDASTTTEASPGDVAFGDAPEDAAPADAFDGAVSCNNPPTGTLLCADWEGVPSVGSGWTGGFTQSGTLGFDTTTFTSPTHSAVVGITPNADAMSYADALLSYLNNNITTFKGLSARVNVQLDDVDPSQQMSILDVAYQSVQALSQVQLEVGGGRVYAVITLNGPPGTPQDLGALPVGSWHTLSVVMTIGIANGVTVSLDQNSVVMPVSLGNVSASPQPRANLGLQTNTPTFAWRVHFDDFLFVAL